MLGVTNSCEKCGAEKRPVVLLTTTTWDCPACDLGGSGPERVEDLRPGVVGAYNLLIPVGFKGTLFELAALVGRFPFKAKYTGLQQVYEVLRRESTGFELRWSCAGRFSTGLAHQSCHEPKWILEADDVSLS